MVELVNGKEEKKKKNAKNELKRDLTENVRFPNIPILISLFLLVIHFLQLELTAAYQLSLFEERERTVQSQLAMRSQKPFCMAKGTFWIV